MRISVAAALLSLAPLGVGAEDPAALLALVRKAYASSPSVTATFVQTYAPAGFAETSPETGRVTLQPPDLIRFEYDGREGKVFTFDGKAARQYVAADRQMVVKALGPSERARLPILFLEAPEGLLARYRVEAAPSDNGLTLLTLKPRSGDEPKSLALTVTPSGEVKRLVILDSGGNRTTFTFTQKRPGPARPAHEFALVPPDGTRVLTE